MKKSSVMLVFLALIAIAPAVAQTKSEDSRTEQDFRVMTDALKLREATAQAAAVGNEKINAVIDRLRTHASPSGLKIDPEASFALAAVDVGRRLIASGKTAEAETFFKAAEISFVAATKASTVQARDKAQFLEELSLIRANYLNKAVQAKADIEAAIELQPDNKELQRAKSMLANGNAERFKDKPSR